MSETFQKLDMAPGVDRRGTSTSAEGGYYDCNLVRFRNGFPQTMGGWDRYTNSTMRGVARFIADWTSTSGTNYFAIGTHFKFYNVIGSNIYDITPIRSTVTLGSNPITTTISSTTVSINDTAHGCVTNDFVTISGVPGAVNGIPDTELNAEHQITVTDVDNYTLEVTTAATSSGTGGGASVQAEYQINVGLNTFVSSTGWGLGEFGENPYGSITSLSTTNQLRLWGGDNFGNDFVLNVRGGGVYYFEDPGGTVPPNRAVNISTLSGAENTPVACLQIMTSDIDRHVIAMGCNPIGSSTVDPLFVRWSDQENAAMWTPLSTNSAGGRRLSSGSFIIGAIKTRQEILIWTDNQLHAMRFVGGDLVYEMDLIEDGISMVGPRAATSANGVVYFMDRGTFWLYDGSVRPLPCPVVNYVFEDINENQSYKIFATTNNDFNEVWFFYPSATSNEIDRYVVHNYASGMWYFGELSRTCWIDAGSRRFPVGTDAGTSEDNSYIYFHETGHDDVTSAISPYLETGAMDIEDGAEYIFLRRYLPDIEWLGTEGNASMTITFKGREHPQDSYTTLATETIFPSTEMVFPRGRARQIAVRYSSTSDDFGWRIGSQRVDMQPDGMK